MEYVIPPISHMMWFQNILPPSITFWNFLDALSSFSSVITQLLTQLTQLFLTQLTQLFLTHLITQLPQSAYLLSSSCTYIRSPDMRVFPYFSCSVLRSVTCLHTTYSSSLHNLTSLVLCSGTSSQFYRSHFTHDSSS